MNQDQDFMAVALDFARLGLGRTSPNPAVGCVIVHGGKILSIGFHRKAGLPHAEVEALQRLRTRPTVLKEATLYVTLEPCCHYGKTPPCTDLIIRSGIRSIVVGMEDPDTRVQGKGIEILRRAGIRVKTGVLEEECRSLNEAYVTHREKKRPFVFLKMATTLKGVVGWKGRGRLSSRLHVTGPAAQRYAHQYRDQVDAILVGINTILADDPLLTTRLPDRRGKDPIRIILDRRLRIPLSARLLHLSSGAKTTLVTAALGQEKKKQRLQKLGCEILYSPLSRNGRFDLKALLKKLAENSIVSVLVEGGPTVWSSFFEKRLVDRLLLFVGTNRWKSLSPGKMIQTPPRPIPLSFKRIDAKFLGQDLLIEGSY